MTSNAPAKKTTSSRSRADKPAPVAINFDTWTRDEAVEAYAVVVGGKRYESVDPMDLDYRVLGKAINRDDPDEVFRVLFGDDDANEILENKIPMGAMLAFNEGVVVHFGLEDFIAAQR